MYTVETYYRIDEYPLDKLEFQSQNQALHPRVSYSGGGESNVFSMYSAHCRDSLRHFLRSGGPNLSLGIDCGGHLGWLPSGDLPHSPTACECVCVSVWCRPRS